jgi:hypothetical protein
MQKIYIVKTNKGQIKLMDAENFLSKANKLEEVKITDIDCEELLSKIVNYRSHREKIVLIQNEISNLEMGDNMESLLADWLMVDIEDRDKVPNMNAYEVIAEKYYTLASLEKQLPTLVMELNRAIAVYNDK